MKPNDQVYTQLIHTDAYHTLCDKQANTPSHKSATRNQSFLLKAASCASVWFRPCAQNRAHLIMLETYRSTCVCCVNEEKSFGSSGIFHEFFIQMNSVSLSSMQASSCLMCAGFLKKTSDEKCSCALNMHSSSDIIFMGYKSGHTLHCYTQKNETSRLFTSEYMKIKMSSLYFTELTVCAVWQMATSSFFVVVYIFFFQGVFTRLHHIFPLCSDVHVFLQWLSL